MITYFKLFQTIFFLSIKLYKMKEIMFFETKLVWYDTIAIHINDFKFQIFGPKNSP